MTAISDRYRRLAAEITRRVEAVPPDRWDAPSPCAGWSARDVLQHLIDSHRSMPGYVGIPVELALSVDDDPPGAWAEARDVMQDLLDDPDQAGLEYDGYFGRTSLERTVDGFLGFDLVVHGWDIARATGQDETLPPDEVERIWADAQQMGDDLRLDGVCGPPVPISGDAPLQDRLIALLGRTP